MSDPGRPVMRTRSRIVPGDDDPRHGTVNGYHNLGCRCDECTEAWRIYHAQAIRRLRASGLPDGDPRHGTYNGYTNYGCRCEPCRAAHAGHARDYYRRTKTGVP